MARIVRPVCRTKTSILRTGILAAVALVMAALFSATSVPVANAANGRTPVIFIPGVLGSLLARKDDPKDIVFGILPDSINRFGELLLPPDLSNNELISVDVVRVVKGPRGGDQYNLFVDRMQRLGYVEGRDLFLFHYDWRLSNFRTATRLRDFIQANGLAGRPIDIIGHSMGGLVALVYIHAYPDEQKVRNYVTMGTPFLGAVDALRVLTEGFQAFGLKNSTVVPAGNVSLVYKVFGSSEAIYELLPFYQECCYIRFKGEGDLQPLVLADPEIWDRYNLWYEKKARLKDERIAKRVTESLNRHRTLTDLVGRPLPQNVRAVAVVGTKGEKTVLRARINANGLNKHIWEVAKDSGDGTVATVSAMGALPRETTTWIESPMGHRQLFDDDAVWAKLGPILVQ
jgi:pimeloyl-ACP methyl ester carboxylesterase